MIESNLPGMTCGHCASRVARTVEGGAQARALPGCQSVIPYVSASGSLK